MARQAGDAHKRERSAGKPCKPARTKQAQPKRDAGQQRKMTFKDKHALETLPGEMEKQGARIAELEARMAEPDLYAKDPKAFEQAAAELQQVRESLEANEERWLELEMQREELGA